MVHPSLELNPMVSTVLVEYRKWLHCMKFFWNRGICVTKVPHISDNTYSWSTAYSADVIMSFLGKRFINQFVVLQTCLIHIKGT